LTMTEAETAKQFPHLAFLGEADTGLAQREMDVGLAGPRYSAQRKSARGPSTATVARKAGKWRPMPKRLPRAAVIRMEAAQGATTPSAWA